MSPFPLQNVILLVFLCSRISLEISSLEFLDSSCSISKSPHVKSRANWWTWGEKGTRGTQGTQAGEQRASGQAEWEITFSFVFISHSYLHQLKKQTSKCKRWDFQIGIHCCKNKYLFSSAIIPVECMLIRRKCSRSIGCTARRRHNKMHAWAEDEEGSRAVGDVVQETWEDAHWGFQSWTPQRALWENFLVGTEGLGEGSGWVPFASQGCMVLPKPYPSYFPLESHLHILPLLRSPTSGFGHWRCLGSSRAPAPAPLFQCLYLAELLAPLAFHQSFFHRVGRLQLLTATSSPACRGKTPGRDSHRCIKAI